MCEDTGMPPCECGCGADAGVYATSAKGHRRGDPRRFVNGHNWNGKTRRERIDLSHYAIEDRGYTTPCWIWKRTRSRKGYGMVWDKQRNRLGMAHRVVYEQEGGTIPDGLQLDHLCQQRACVNPEHLEPVTQAVNQQRGANARLTREQADEIRRRGRVGMEGRRQGRQSGESLAALAREFGVSHPVVTGIVRGHLWP